MNLYVDFSRTAAKPCGIFLQRLEFRLDYDRVAKLFDDLDVALGQRLTAGQFAEKRRAPAHWPDALLAVFENNGNFDCHGSHFIPRRPSACA